MDTDNTKDTIPPLTGRQKKQLRALGHHLHPVVYVGKEGITQTVVAAIDDAITAHELIKVKLGQNCPLAKKEAAGELARQAGAVMVQLIGKTVLLYLPNPDLPAEKQIRL